MFEIRALDGSTRPPTWGEKSLLEELRARGVEDVYLDPADAGSGFWNVVIQATYRWLLSPSADAWQEWADEVNAITGWRIQGDAQVFEGMVAAGNTLIRDHAGTRELELGAEWRYAAVEYVLDVVAADPEGVGEFRDFINDRAR